MISAQRTSRRRLVRGSAAVMITACALRPWAAFAQATGDSRAAVIAGGVVNLDETPMAWQAQLVTSNTVDRKSVGPGFFYVHAGTATAGTGGVQRQTLQPGQALFAPADPPMGITPSDDGQIVAFTLVPESTTSVPAPLRFDGQAFSPSPGAQELVLVRATIQPDDPLVLPRTDAPAVLFVLGGALTVEEPATGSVSGPLKPGAMIDYFAGDVLRAASDPVTLVAAMDITGAANRVAPDEPAATPGSLSFKIAACPVADISLLDPAACFAPPEGTELELFVVGSGAEQHTLADAEFDGARYTWRDLPPGDYFLHALALPPGYARFYTGLPDGLNTDPTLGYSVGPNEGYTVTIDADQPDHEFTVYLLPG